MELILLNVLKVKEKIEKTRSVKIMINLKNTFYVEIET